MEDAPELAKVPMAVLASMWPRLMSRGRRQQARPHYRRLARFNVATTDESWKTCI